MTTIYMRKPNVDKAATIRSDLKALGIKANVRYFNWSYRIVLPEFTDEASAKLRDYIVEHGYRLAGGATVPTDPSAYSRAWSKYEGRGQIFLYDAQ